MKEPEIPKGHLNMKALAEKDGLQEYGDQGLFAELLRAKHEAINCILRNRESFFIISGEENLLHLDQVKITVGNELICHIVRDDSPFADYTMCNDEEGMRRSLEEALDVASLRERVQIEINRKNMRPFSELLEHVKLLRESQERYLSEFNGQSVVGPVRIWGALHPHVERYGKILQLDNGPVVQGLEDKPFYYVNGDTTKVKMGGKAPVEVGRIIIKQRPFTIFVMDHHAMTSEVLTPDRHCIIPFSTPDQLDKPCFNGELFLVPPGAWIHINQKTIHYAPFPLFAGVLTSSVIFAEGTTTEEKADFHHHHYQYKRRFF